MIAIENNLENLRVTQNETKTTEEILKMEIRKLPDEIKRKVAKILENRNNFEEFMLAIPKQLSDFLIEGDNYDRKYTIGQVQEIKNAGDALKRGRLNGEILFDEWGTSGRQRPRVVHLISALEKVGFIRASNEIRSHFGIYETTHETVEHQTSVGRAGDNDITKKVLQDLQNAIPKNISNVKEYSYNDIREKTNNFNKEDYRGLLSPGRLIGSGGFSDVYLAIDLVEDDKFVAVKVMKKVDDRNYMNFIRELKIISGVNHVNILKLLGYTLDVKACLIYEYASGGPLSIQLKKARKAELVYDLKERVKNLWEVSNALVYLHGKALVHRDIKPDNILLHGRIAKLCDFGLSKPLIEGKATKTTFAGTLYYMAPELQKEITASADVFAFGVVMLLALTDLELIDDKRGQDYRYLV